MAAAVDWVWLLGRCWLLLCVVTTRSARSRVQGGSSKSSNSETQNSLTWTVELRGRVRLVVADQGCAFARKYKRDASFSG